MSVAERASGQTKPLLAYFGLAYAISWAIAIPLALEQQQVIPTILPFWTHYLVAYGPLLAALLVTGRTEGKAGLAALSRRVFHWRVHPVW